MNEVISGDAASNNLALALRIVRDDLYAFPNSQMQPLSCPQPRERSETDVSNVSRVRDTTHSPYPIRRSRLDHTRPGPHEIWQDVAVIKSPDRGAVKFEFRKERDRRGGGGGEGGRFGTLSDRVP